VSSRPVPQDPAQRVAFRAMRIDDVPDVVTIERATYAFPWSEGIFRDCIRVGYLCRIAELDGETVGYGILSCGAGEAHVLNVCIRSDVRGSGVGRRMMDMLLERAHAEGMEYAFLEVRPSNPAAIALYESMGFMRIGVRRAYYQAHGGREDAIVYRLGLQRGRD